MINCPRLTIAGLGGDTGKTAVSVGLCRLLKKKGYSVTPFKKGPDYIDMGWLSQAAHHPCYNIDLFLMNRDQVLTSFSSNTEQTDIAIIEGNRGLYDGMDLEGSVSTSEIAKLLYSPVILVLDCTKVTRTVAALVLGCKIFDRDVTITGIILNKVANLRHEETIRKSIDQYCQLPVLGAIPKLPHITFPGRHLGLVPYQEHPMYEEAIENAAEVMKMHVDIERLFQIAHGSLPIDFISEVYPETVERNLNIGIIHDSAFQFYYQENIDVLRKAGVNIIEFSALKDDFPASLDALYIGGGFPETHASALSENEKLRKSIKEAAEGGLPIYAECGGLMYLAQELIWEGKTYPMVGILPFTIGVSKKPQGHGYTIAKVETQNPYFPVGQVLRGHEFHYSYISSTSQKDGGYLAFKMVRGEGIMNKMDGFCYKNILATYTHLHALGTNEWAQGIIRRAKAFNKKILLID